MRIWKCGILISGAAAFAIAAQACRTLESDRSLTASLHTDSTVVGVRQTPQAYAADRLVRATSNEFRMVLR